MTILDIWVLIHLYLNLTGGCFLPLFATMASFVSEMDIFVPKRFVFGQVEALFWSCAWFVHPLFKNKGFSFVGGGGLSLSEGTGAIPNLWQQERDQQLRELEFVYNDRSAHLVQSYIHPSLWFIAEGPRDSTMGIPPFDNRLRSDEWTAKLHKHKILGYVGVYVDDLLISRSQIIE